MACSLAPFLLAGTGTLADAPKSERSTPDRELAIANAYAFAGQPDAARSAYERARLLYQQDENRLGEANVLLGVGHLEHVLGRNVQARQAYQKARVFYQQEEDRLGEANVLLGLGMLNALEDPVTARVQLHGALTLYEQIEVSDSAERTREEIRKLDE